MNRIAFVSFSWLLVFSLTIFCSCTQAQETGTEKPGLPSADDTAASRNFELVYGGKIKGLTKDSKVRVWLPVAQTTSEQKVTIVDSVLPEDVKETAESVHGNKMKYFEFSVGDSDEFPFEVKYQIERSEINSLNRESSATLTDAEQARYIEANRMVPIDGKPLELLQGVELPESDLEAARALYERVDGHMEYDKSKPGYGNGDVLWACDSQFGNCTDFHSLFISFARSRKIPAHFEIGFPIPRDAREGKIGGYHCWAKFFVKERGWVPVDISEADKHPELKQYYFGNLTEDRVSFTKGRDLILEPKQDGDPLNYFVYPYVEVDGKPLGKENIELNFQFKDLTSN